MKLFTKNDFYEKNMFYIKYSVIERFTKFIYIVCISVNNKELILVLLKYFIMDLKGKKITSDIGFARTIFHECWKSCTSLSISMCDPMCLNDIPDHSLIKPFLEGFITK